MSRFLRTLAATPEPSLTRPRRMCSVPMYSWLKRRASWLASCITLRARSVKRSYIPAVSARKKEEPSGNQPVNDGQALNRSKPLGGMRDEGHAVGESGGGYQG